ncbi:MAG TPA: DUF1737 domain-containing protein [Bacteroidales bacterium]|nr:DUF1737 domain-containing protein [Bacteroidales bacterium]
MKEYKVITHYVTPEFEQLVAHALAEGWQLVGGVSLNLVEKGDGEYQMIFAQALAR